jgi:methyl coenzyme M reductase gamma subunit
MAPQLIRFHGTYRYDSQEALEAALSSARAQLEDEEVADPAMASLRSFSRHGTSLRIDVLLPAIAEIRFAASDVFQTLARDAVEGAVEASAGTHHVDFFPSGGDD